MTPDALCSSMDSRFCKDAVDLVIPLSHSLSFSTQIKFIFYFSHHQSLFSNTLTLSKAEQKPNLQ